MMPFHCVPVEGKQFDSITEAKEWVRDEKRRLKRVPVIEVLENGARFFDDEYFGDNDHFFKFNQHGIRALLQPLGLRFDTLELVEQPGLVSELLNDLIAQREIRDRLEQSDLVVDIASDTILGTVSNSYITYSNESFLHDIQRLLGNDRQADLFPEENDATGRFRFVRGFSVNTQNYLRFVITIKSGRVIGRCGESEDVSEVGVQFKNSMVGDAAVSIQYFVHRLICANGLIVPAGASYSRVYHSGKRENFLERLGKCFQEVERKIGSAGESIKTLMAIDFDPEALVRANLVQPIFDIIPGSRSKVMEVCGIRRRPKTKMTESERILHEAAIVGGIPESYAGVYSSRVFNSAFRDNATMFDFINIFTEYAQSQPIHERLAIEEKAGVLTDQIAKHKKKFRTEKAG